MPVTDPIADMLTRIRNALQAKHSKVQIPGSRLKLEIARILYDEGYVNLFEFTEDNKQGMIKIELRYLSGGAPAISGLKRISSPGRRIYVGRKDVPRVLGGLGIAILSTSKGVLTDRESRREKVGGEVLCHIW